MTCGYRGVKRQEDDAMERNRLGVGGVVCLAAAMVGCTDRGSVEGLDRMTAAVSPGQSGWPANWLVHDIGASAGASADYTSGVFTLTGIASSNPNRGIATFASPITDDDVMRFLHIDLANVSGLSGGDVELIARVSNVSAPVGRNMGQFGIAIRSGTATTAEMGAVGFQIGGAITSGASACGSGVAHQASCSGAPPDCYLADDSNCSCVGSSWDCTPGHQHFVTYRTFEGSEAILNPQASEAPVAPALALGSNALWIRFQRLGADYSVAWQHDSYGPMWRPIASGSGGVYVGGSTETIGLFVSSLNSNSTSPLTVQFDNVQVRAPVLRTRRDGDGEVFRSTWIGSDSTRLSGGALAHDLVTMFVGPTPDYSDTRIYKHTGWVEGAIDLQMLKQSDGSVVRSNLPTNVAFYTERTALTGDGPDAVSTVPYLYLANRTETDPSHFCIDRRLSSDFTLPSTDAPCVCTGTPCAYPSERRLTAIGGMTAIKHTSNTQRVYVTQPDRDGNPGTDDPKLLELALETDGNGKLYYEVHEEWDVAARPGALVGAHARLFIAHSSSDFPYVDNYDAPYATGRIGCYKYTDGSDCGEIPHCSSPSSTDCVVNPTAVAILPGAASNGSQDVLFVADNGLGRLNIHKFVNLHTTSPDEVTSSPYPLGHAGGIYAGNAGAMVDSSYGGTTRFYNLVGLGVDPSGSLYVGSNAQPGFDLGLMGRSSGSAVVDFDPSTDGADAYAPNMHFGFDTSQTTPGSEWDFQAITYDPSSGERDAGGALSRSGGIPMVRQIGEERFMYVFSELPDQTTYPGVNLETYGRPYSLNIYRFEGELAKLVSTLRYLPADVDPIPKDIDSDCNMVVDDGNRSYEAQLELWRDTDDDGVVDGGETSATPDLSCFVNPSCDAWETELECPGGLECDNYFDSANTACDGVLGDETSPSASGAFGVDVTEGGDIWWAVGPQIWHFDHEGLSAQDVPTYGWNAPLSVAGLPFDSGEPHPTRADGVAYDDVRDVLYVFDNTAATVAAYADPLGTPDFLFGLDPVPNFTTPWSPGMDACNAPRGFDFVGDKVFVATFCGPVAVFQGHNENCPEKDGELITFLTAGPALSGMQMVSAVSMGIRAFRRSTGEYLVSVHESTYRAHSIISRWTPPDAYVCDD
jgi:hypothetical protein